MEFSLLATSLAVITQKTHKQYLQANTHRLMSRDARECYVLFYTNNDSPHIMQKSSLSAMAWRVACTPLHSPSICWPGKQGPISLKFKRKYPLIGVCTFPLWHAM